MVYLYIYMQNYPDGPWVFFTISAQLRLWEDLHFSDRGLYALIHILAYLKKHYMFGILRLKYRCDIMN